MASAPLSFEAGPGRVALFCAAAARCEDLYRRPLPQGQAAPFFAVARWSVGPRAEGRCLGEPEDFDEDFNEDLDEDFDEDLDEDFDEDLDENLNF